MSVDRIVIGKSVSYSESEGAEMLDGVSAKNLGVRADGELLRRTFTVTDSRLRGSGALECIGGRYEFASEQALLDALDGLPSGTRVVLVAGGFEMAEWHRPFGDALDRLRMMYSFPGTVEAYFYMTELGTAGDDKVLTLLGTECSEPFRLASEIERVFVTCASRMLAGDFSVTGFTSPSGYCKYDAEFRAERDLTPTVKAGSLHYVECKVRGCDYNQYSDAMIEIDKADALRTLAASEGRGAMFMCFYPKHQVCGIGGFRYRLFDLEDPAHTWRRRNSPRLKDSNGSSELEDVPHYVLDNANALLSGTVDLALDQRWLSDIYDARNVRRSGNYKTVYLKYTGGI